MIVVQVIDAMGDNRDCQREHLSRKLTTTFKLCCLVILSEAFLSNRWSCLVEGSFHLSLKTGLGGNFLLWARADIFLIFL